MANVELHIFTNCTSVIKDNHPIIETYQSFASTFGSIIPTIWLDPIPNLNDVDWYTDVLYKSFPHSKINITKSLADGYIKMIDSTESEFIFVLEHDWKFLKHNIKHSLTELCDIAKTNNISHLRLQRLHNSENMMGIDIIGNNPFIKTVISAFNNPHILYVPEYKKTARKYIENNRQSHGIEENLINRKDCNFAVYGIEPTIEHLDGRSSFIWEKDKQVIDAYLKILKRYPDQSGFNHYVSSKYTIDEIEKILLNSDEYKNGQL